MDADALETRLDAVERAVTDGETDCRGLADAAGRDARLDELEERLSEVESRLDELDAAVQAVRGYLGGVDAVDEAVERRANLALATAERLESELLDRSGLSVERLPEGDDDCQRGRSAEGAPDPDGRPDDLDAGRAFVDRIRDAL